MQTTRRGFLRTSAAAATLLGTVGLPHIARAAEPRFVVIGGGPGGATTAKYLKRYAPNAAVTVIEPHKTYTTCFMSNEVIGGDRALSTLEVSLDGLRRHGVDVVESMATGIDADAKTVTTEGGDTFAFDRCILSPGVDFRYDAIEGYSAAAAEVMPHAWKAGPQTTLLRRQLEAMEDGGTVILSVPANPFRCPPGPYERISLIAHYLKQHKPKSKILVLDAKDTFSKMPLFTQTWEMFYGYGTDTSLIEWIPKADGGTVTGVNPDSMEVTAVTGTFKGDVVNIIPPQQAGAIAVAAGVVEDGWVPVNKSTFESLVVDGIHVLGDASAAASMPKSASSANAQGKAVAAGVLALARGEDPPVPHLANTCYSIGGPDHGFSVAAVYAYDDFENALKPVQGAGGISPIDADAEYRRREAFYAHSWFENIKADIWS
ncbi:twin-arginine translocation signal domain-containing protein [Roseospira marina]|uniref:Twin-arginine translocation signal domain-containing protein n=1 Tax=Roseospira marina TaxID=140057 RepID=A0A5M6IDY5_9PROT|nr:NAD(P)/FAD-dependent oxidoreductase [Roseospira marina]KAA5606177.1 twin-arginine translocation signal domain-containing protein [Roseospira marina]MBB4314320.1 sulfide dehydrogenase [flavocytochrome c] flavoprotein subunit [Roseospira marina]MBB5087480.1 sulfide dehydrogenase [flavocytochrome c] flavoprotein subunit [Roseospira marina]